MDGVLVVGFQQRHHRLSVVEGEGVTFLVLADSGEVG